MIPSLADLIARLESATEVDQELLVDECNSVVFARGWISRRDFIRNQDWINDGAYESAAIALVPRHHLWQLKCGIQAQAIVWMLETDYDDRTVPTGYALPHCPAIALCLALFRARLKLGKEDVVQSSRLTKAGD
jgi:hypothetical protein